MEQQKIIESEHINGLWYHKRENVRGSKGIIVMLTFTLLILAYIPTLEIIGVDETIS